MAYISEGFDFNQKLFVSEEDDKKITSSLNTEERKIWNRDHLKVRFNINDAGGCAKHQFALDTAQVPPWENVVFQGQLTTENSIEITSICQGDSRGPVLKRHIPLAKNNYKIIGVVSERSYKDHSPETIVSVIKALYNTRCVGEDFLGLASSVWVHKDWIAQAKIAFEQGLHQISPDPIPQSPQIP